jgi:hypothetical protein
VSEEKYDFTIHGLYYQICREHSERYQQFDDAAGVLLNALVETDEQLLRV